MAAEAGPLAAMIETRGLTKIYSHKPVRTGGSRSEMWAEFLMSRLTGRSWGEFSSPQLKGELRALDNVTLDVAPGEVFGVLGRNGAGKTTLVKILCGILEPTAGEARVAGRDVRREPDAVKQLVTVVQAGGWLGFDYQLSIKWNLEFWARLYGLPPSAARERTNATLRLVELDTRAGDSAGTLSSGLRQRLALAKGFIMDAPVFLLDEPTVALDPVSARQVREFIKGELSRSQHRTVFLCTHNMEEAEELCDRVAILDSGRVAACGRPGELQRMVTHEVVRAVAAPAPPELVQGLKRSHPEWRVVDRVQEDASYRLRIGLCDGSSAGGVAGALRACGLEPREVEPVSPTLEDVFCWLVGRKT